MNTLVITAACSYEPVQLRPFLASAHRHLPDSTMLVLTDRGDSAYKDQLARWNPNVQIVVPADYWWRMRLWLDADLMQALVRSRKVKSSLRLLIRPFAQRSSADLRTAFLNVSLARYLWAATLLEGIDLKPDQVLLCDSRDVVFQGDPFECSQGRLVCGEEPIGMADCPVNSVWFEYLYSNDGLKELDGAHVLCSGVTFGPFPLVLAYVKAMVSEISTKYAMVTGRAWLDQPIHNQILRRHGRLPFVACPNGDELVATLHHSNLDEFRFDEREGLLTKSRRRVRIVHQYDRHERLTRWVERVFQ